MKQKLWLTPTIRLAYCMDRELCKAIGYLKEQARVLIEHQEKDHERILPTNRQRMPAAAATKRLSRQMLQQCTELSEADAIGSNPLFG